MSRRILVDTNIWLDVMLDRAPHADNSAASINLAQSEGATLVLGATTVTTLHYFVQKFLDVKTANKVITDLLDTHEVATVSGEMLPAAVDGKIGDFEDSVLYEAGRRVNVDLILTRNPTDFESGALPVYTPSEFLAARPEL